MTSVEQTAEALGVEPAELRRRVRTAERTLLDWARHDDEGRLLGFDLPPGINPSNMAGPRSEPSSTEPSSTPRSRPRENPGPSPRRPNSRPHSAPHDGGDPQQAGPPAESSSGLGRALEQAAPKATDAMIQATADHPELMLPAIRQVLPAGTALTVAKYAYDRAPSGTAERRALSEAIMAGLLAYGVVDLSVNGRGGAVGSLLRWLAGQFPAETRSTGAPSAPEENASGTGDAETNGQRADMGAIVQAMRNGDAPPQAKN